MRVGLFGGSFNPPHVAHQMVALYVLETAALDELWFIPAYQHAFGKPLVPFEDRLHMCELATKPLGPRVRVVDVERAIGGDSRTVYTLRRLRQLHPEHAFSLIIGADLVAEVPWWESGTELLRSVPFVVVGRGGMAADADRVSMPEVSSTMLRDRLAAGKSVEGLVPRTVLDYIYERGLFGPEKPSEETSEEPS